jgi:N-methylhydantoinase A/oxoprolinase/acetone carboxylase beta subunit
LGIFERRVKNLRAQDTFAADNDRVQMALEISRYLYGQQRPTATVVNASTASLLRNLVSASKSMEQTSKELSKSVKALPSHKDLLTEIKKMKARLFLGDK